MNIYNANQNEMKIPLNLTASLGSNQEFLLITCVMFRKSIKHIYLVSILMSKFLVKNPSI